VPIKTLPAALATTAGLLLALTACTTADTGDAPSGAATPAETIPAAAGEPDECVDGIAYLAFTEETTELSLPDGCSTVLVLGDGGTAEIGPVDDLSVMGNGATITVESVGRLELTGNDNTVTHGGDAPEMLGDEETTGTGNTVTAR